MTNRGNHAFRAARESRGWTQEDFVEAFAATARTIGLNLDLSVRQVRRWESENPPWPQRPYRKTLEQLLGLPPEALGFARTVRGQGTASEASMNATPETILVPMLAPQITPETAVFLSDLHRPDVDDVVWAADGALTGPSTIAALWASIQNYWSLDDRFGGRTLRSAVLGQLRYVEVLQSAAPDDRTERELHIIAQEFYRLAGWTHFDSSKFDAARRYFTKAAKMAGSIEDWPFLANVLACMSLQATYENQANDAVALVGEAKDLSRTTATPRVRAMLAMRESFGHAVLGDRSATHRALAEAHSSFEAATDDDHDPAWARYFDETKLLVDTGIARSQLGEHRPAAALIETALDREDRQRARVRAFHELWLANTRLQAGELAEACEIAATVCRTAGQLESMRITEHVEAFRDRVLPQQDERPVLEFLDIYNEVKATRRPPELTV